MKEEKEIPDYNYYEMEEIVCPHCGYVFTDSWDFRFEQDGETSEIECQNDIDCGKEFHVTFNLRATYTSSL